ncbi:hypothetical protein [Consotaella aegiceratis]|uniref:hypothetical protein n=1 Tax=Consotaella aegiceratis TaxID=3097961 RepID=UPI002F402A7A
MPVIELVVAICLVGDPNTCKEQRFQFTEGTSLMGCVMRAQPFLADWALRHSRWSVQKWHCDYPQRREQKA